MGDDRLEKTDYIDLPVVRRFAAATNHLLTAALANVCDDSGQAASTRLAVYAAFLQASAANGLVNLLRTGAPIAALPPANLTVAKLQLITGCETAALQHWCNQLTANGVLIEVASRIYQFSATIEDISTCIDAHFGA